MTRTSTAEAVRSPALLRRGRMGRRSVALAVVAMVLAGLTTVLGERTGQAVVAGGGYELAVEYPTRTRGGLTQDIDITVRREGGFEAPVTVSISTEYLKLFEEQGIQPQPSRATASADRVEWEFDPPSGDTLRVVYDVRVEPHRHRGGAGRLAVRDGDSEPVSVRLETAVMP